MKRKFKRGEIQMAAVNLLDLGFTVAAISFMLNKTTANIYTHLKRAGRMKGRVFIRDYPRTLPYSIPLDALSPMSRIFSQPLWIAPTLVSLARAAATIPATPPASATKRTYKRSGKKRA